MNWHHVASCHYHLLLYRSFTLLLYIVEGNFSLFYESFSLAAWVEMFFFSLGVIAPLVGLGLLLIHENFCGFSITHNDTTQSVGLLWMSDQLVTETST